MRSMQCICAGHTRLYACRRAGRALHGFLCGGDGPAQAGVDGGGEQRGGDGDADERARVVREDRQRDAGAGEDGDDEADQQRRAAATALHLKRRPVPLRAARCRH